MPTGINDYLFQTKELWANLGAPAETFSDAGNFWKYISKGADRDWEGNATALMAVRSKRQGNFGANYSRLLASHTTSGGQKFIVPAGKYFGLVSFDTRFLEFTSTSKNLVSGMEGKADEIDQTLKAYQTSMSQVMWQDGRGQCGKGNGTYSVAGAVITFLNRRSAACFEEGDVLVFISEAAMTAAPVGTLPVPRAGSVTVTAVNEDLGTVTCSGNITAGIATAVNTDWISKFAFFADAQDGIPNGVFTWLARNATTAAQSLYGVTRSVNPGRLSGRRVEISTSSSPWSICSKIMQESENTGADIDTIWVPSHETEALMEEMAGRNITMVPASIGKNDPVNLSIKVNGIAVSYGSTNCVIMSDRFLINHGVTEANDRQYVGLNMRDWRLKMGPSGWGFKDYDGDGSLLTRDVQTERLYAEIGGWAALFTKDTGHQIYAGNGTTL